MGKIVDKDRWGNTHTFEIVPDFPSGYTIWNIGRSNFPYKGYIPLCVADANCHVNLNTLKAMKAASEELALALLKEAGKHRVTRGRYLKLATQAEQ